MYNKISGAKDMPERITASLFLRRAYAMVDLAGTTDDASVIERLGEPVLVVEGDPRNIKITYAADLALAAAILALPEEDS